MAKATPHGSPAWSRRVTIADYDGATDKINSETEGKTPYAWTFYREFRDNLRGSAYAKTDDGLLHVENVALARLFSSVMRSADKAYNNTIPDTADEKLEEWVEVLAIPTRPTDSRERIRRQCAAQFRVLAQGPTRQGEDDSIATLLGGVYVRSWRSVGSATSNPPTNTFWPGVNPGPAEYDLGGGAWFSERCHLIVETVAPAASPLNLAEYYDLVNTQLFHLLNRICPAWVSFDWAVNVEAGFILDVDDLDFGALGD